MGGHLIQEQFVCRRRAETTRLFHDRYSKNVANSGEQLDFMLITCGDPAEKSGGQRGVEDSNRLA